MKDLIKISIIVVVFGLGLLYFISVNIGYQDVNIGELDNSHIGKLIQIRGNVTSVYGEDDKFVDLEDGTGKIKVILWSDTLEQLRLSGINTSEIKEGVKMEVRGTVDLYRGEFEIVPIKSQIRIL